MSTPSSRSRSQRKIKTIGSATIRHTLTTLTKFSMICARTYPKSWENGPNRPKTLKINNSSYCLSIPPSRSRSQNKIKTTGHSITCDTLITSCNYDISHFLICSKTWGKERKWLTTLLIIFFKFEQSLVPILILKEN